MLDLLLDFFVWGGFWALLCLVLCASKLAAAPRLLLLAALILALYKCALALPPWQTLAALLGFEVPASPPQYHPLDWTGKAVALLLTVFLIRWSGYVTPAAAGLRGLQMASLWVVGPVVSLVAALLFASASFSGHAFPTLWWHERVFHALVPGLGEELFYRGLLLGLLRPIFAQTLLLPGTRTSWGGLLTVVLFGLGHVIKFPLSYLVYGVNWRVLAHIWWRLVFYLPLADIGYYLLMGLLFLWVRERTGSVWAAVAAHCLINTALAIGHTIT